MDNNYRYFLEYYKVKSQKDIKADIFDLGKHILEKDDDSAHFLYFAPLILCFADSTAHKEELDLVNEINDVFSLGHSRVSPNDEIEKFDKLVNGNVSKFLSYLSVVEQNKKTEPYKTLEKEIVQYMIAFVSHKESVNDKEIRFLEQIGNVKLAGYGLAYTKSSKKIATKANNEVKKQESSEESDEEVLDNINALIKKMQNPSFINFDSIQKEYKYKTNNELIKVARDLFDIYANLFGMKDLIQFHFFYVMGVNCHISKDLADLYNECSNKYDFHNQPLEIEYIEFDLSMLQILDGIQLQLLQLYVYFVDEGINDKTSAPKKYEIFERLLCSLALINRFDETEEIDLSTFKAFCDLAHFPETLEGEK